LGDLNEAMVKITDSPTNPKVTAYLQETSSYLPGDMDNFALSKTTS
jgi:hypothetical protein